MGKRFLIDSNAIIDFFNYALPQKGIDLLLSVEPVISIITQIEIFSKPNLLKADLLKLNDFVEIAVIHNVDKDIAIKTIEIRQKHKIKLPDAVIAATALHYDLTLITRNVADFGGIKGLKVINPHTI